ncbi:DUF7575 domain-containing protein [Haladaptatus cibarius]|uniref:DUF7575 domain-containing protein n=1 Tax=Haladaptatus cibarius TaxID=453847 RepID=UPI000678AA71|nr:hypothetical protein [Haladaptatus cibarius]
MTRKRPWLAAVLALVYPGFGHAYLRQWLRALLWFAFALVTAMVFIPPETFQAVEGAGFSAYYEQLQALPFEVTLPILVVQLCNVIDAYWSALRNNRASATTTTDGEGEVRCPHCRRNVDEDLDFCHWCTNPIDTEPAAQ